MSIKLFRLQSVGIFIFSIGWFSLFQPWGGFNDPDGFYHAKAAALLSERGPFLNFPWLDLTAFHATFTDHHFLFHVLLMPFVRGFGTLVGAQIAAVVFAAAFATVFFLCLRRLRVPAPAVWTLLLVMSSALLVRLTLAKASPLAIAWFVLGLGALLLRSRALVFFAGLGFSLTHGGSIILPVALACMAMGDALFDRFVRGRSWRSAFCASRLAFAAWAFAGAMLGTFLHPNFPDNLAFMWIQVVKIGVLTPQEVRLGREWFPPAPGEFLLGALPMIFGALLVAYGLITARRTPLDLGRARDATAAALPVALLVALAFKSRRFMEYLLPAMALWLALLATLVDWKKVRDDVRNVFSKPLSAVAVAFLAAVGLSSYAAASELRTTHRLLHTEVRKFHRLDGAMAVLHREARMSDRVFHSDWDLFPELFAADDRLRYTSGLDPTFLLETRPDLSALLHDILYERSDRAPSEIAGRFGARFVLLERGKHERFERLAAHDANLSLIYEDKAVRLYRLAD